MSRRNSWNNLFSTQRHVNLIYFVDAAKTKTIRLSLRAASFIVLGSVFVLLWSIVSGYLLVRLQAKQGDLRAELGLSRSVIFEYQAMHDGVFEQAYPELRERVFDSKRPALAAGNDGPANSLSAKLLGDNTPNGFATGNRVPSSNPEKNKLPLHSSGKSPVSVANPSIARRDRAIEVLFDLRNNDSNRKAEGFIWGVASLEHTSGERASVTVPRSFLISAAGEPVNEQQGQRFRIRRYARRSFIFALPPNFSGKVLTVSIAFVGRNGEYRSSYAIPANLNFNQVADASTKPAKKSANAARVDGNSAESGSGSNAAASGTSSAQDAPEAADVNSTPGLDAESESDASEGT